MFNTGASHSQRQRTHPQTLSPSVPYRQQEYYPISDSSNGQSILPPESSYRTTTGSFSRDPDIYHGNFYASPRHTEAISYPQSTTYAQSYDRYPSSSNYPNVSPFDQAAHDHSQQQYSEGARLEQSNWGTLKRHDNPNIVDNPMIPVTHSYSTDSLPAAPGPVPQYSAGEPDTWTHERSRSVSSGSPKPKKPRREKPRIALAPDQPPTTQGKPRARVYVACLQW